MKTKEEVLEKVEAAIKALENHKEKVKGGVHTETSPVPVNGQCPSGWFYDAASNSCILDLG